MKISDMNIYRYALALDSLHSLRGKRLDQREGIIIHFKSDQKREGFGEIAPLPGLSQETFEEVLQQIQQFKLYLIDQEIPQKMEKLDGKFSAWLDPFKLYPSVRCGIEMAVLNLIADTKGIPLNRLVSSSSHDHVRVSGLAQGSPSDAEQQVHQLITDGFTAIKLKVGGDLSDDIKKVRAANQMIDGRALLHLDANQGWDFDQAVEFGNEIGPTVIDYIEEPFKDLTRIPEFFQQTLIPVALDESLARRNFDEIKSIEGVDILILKPMLLGGIEKTCEWMNEAKKFALETVISSSFESSIGILALAHLASTSSRHNMAGLDTLKYFKHNLFNEDLKIDKGKINLTRGMRDINFDLLEKVSS